MKVNSINSLYSNFVVKTPAKETIYADKAKIEIEYDGDGNIVAAKAN